MTETYYRFICHLRELVEGSVNTNLMCMIPLDKLS